MPRVSSTHMAKIMRDYRKTVGARINKKGMKAVPEVELAAADETAAKLPSQQEVSDEDDEETVNLKAKKKVPLETGYSEGDDAELAGMSADVSAPPAKPKASSDHAARVIPSIAALRAKVAPDRRTDGHGR